MNQLKILGTRKVKGREFDGEESQVLCALYKIEYSRRIGARDLFIPALRYNIISTCCYHCALKRKVRELSRYFRRLLSTVLLTFTMT